MSETFSELSIEAIEGAVVADIRFAFFCAPPPFKPIYPERLEGLKRLLGEGTGFGLYIGGKRVFPKEQKKP